MKSAHTFWKKKSIEIDKAFHIKGKTHFKDKKV